MAEMDAMGEKILTLAKALTKADESEQELLEMLCRTQETLLEGRLKDGVSKKACGDAFPCAAAFLSAAALESARAGGEEASSLRAGDLTVTKRSSDESGRRLDALRAQAWALMRPYTEDGAFCFFGVTG